MVNKLAMSPTAAIAHIVAHTVCKPPQYACLISKSAGLSGIDFKISTRSAAFREYVEAKGTSSGYESNLVLNEF